MREIKFRAWHKTEEMFVDAKVFDFNVGVIGTSAYVSKDGKAKYRDIMQNFDIQQYTGFKDKNGVEIYEGDIVKVADLNYKVFWDEWKWNASCPYYHQYHHPQFGDSFRRNARCGEVIGNIHENGDLLK